MKRIVMCSVILFVGILMAGVSFAQQPLETPKRVMPFEDPEPGAQMVPPALQRAPGGTATTYNVPGDYATIQAAIDAAISGDVIIVASGTYAEDLLIDGKNLTIQGGGSGGSIITGDATNTQYIVKITNSAVVDFSGFTVDGTGKNIKYGVWATAGTDGDIHDNEVKNVQEPGAYGTAVRRDDSQIDVTDNTVYGFGRIGIYTRDDVIGNTDTGVISGNTVTGLGGSDPDRLSYGISVYSGNPTVDNNDIYDCVSGANVAAWASCGLDVWTGSTSVISNNDFFDSDYGIISNSASPVMSGNTFTNISGEDVRLDYFVKGNPTPHWAEYYDTIQDAIDAIPSTTYLCIVWIGVYSGGGTYAEAVNVNKTCQIYGYDMSAVTIDAVGYGVNNAGVYVNADDVVLYDLTVEGDTGSSLPRYGVKFADYDGCWMERVEVRTCYRTGIDILGATNLTITDVSSHDNGGNGIQMNDATNVTLENITTSGNAWGGVGIFTWGQYTPVGTSGVVFSGSNRFGETSADVGSIYLEEGNYSNPSSPWPITYSTDILDGADVTVQLADVTHTLKGNSDNDNYYTRFYATLGDAQNAAAGTVSHILDGRYITELAGTNLYVPANLGSIQAAVDAANPGDVIHVDAGSFEEQVEIDKNLTLDGAGKGVTTIESPVSLTKYFTTSLDNYPVVYIHDAADVTVSNLTVDGLGRGNSNYRFDGVAFRNAGGSVESCELLNIADTPFSGAQHGVALYLYNDDSVSRTIDVLDNDFSGFQKNAMALNLSATTPLVVDVTGNTVTGAGATGVTAQNGIQVSGALATGTIEDNVVDGIGYTGSGWVATSILVYDGDVDVIGNTISNAHMGIYLIDAAGSISGNTLAMEKIGSYCWGIAASDPPEAVPSPFGIEENGPMASSGMAMAPAATRDVDIMDNYVAFSGPDNTGT
ncbi:MAG: right-handed parallel beta-helix repeat-containing protein, partial [bacterium]